MWTVYAVIPQAFMDSNKHCNTILQNCSSIEQYYFVDVHILYETSELFNTGGDGDGDELHGPSGVGMGKIMWGWGGDAAVIYYHVTV